MRRDWNLISARTLGMLALADACERCFWIRQKIGEPPSPFPGIFSSIDSYSKKVVLAFMEWHQRVPDWFQQFGLNGQPLKSPHFMWFKVPVLNGELVLRGVPDEILLTPNDTLTIVDYKTARFKENDSLRPLYEVQLNVYARIAETLQIAKPGYPFPRPVEALGLLYYDPITEVDCPEKVHSGGFLMEFRACWSPVERQDAWVDELVERAWSILSRSEPPPTRPNCPTCEAYQLIASALRGT
ncbi:MAG: PD-(D/E)XK nuclease family protein [Fimbriimonadales bacterium]|nr:PD-(D/E)XK nuclease family protein [Fimbriimonadales bacterium]